MRWYFIVFVLMLIVHLQEASARDAITTITDVPYGEAHPRQILDIYLPSDTDETVPLIVMIHGGGYVFGSKDILRDVALYYAEMGYAVVVPSYRLAPEFTYSAPIEDIFCAMAWTVNHSNDFGFDSTQVILLGESAGANAAALLGTVDMPEQFLSNCDHALPDDISYQAIIGLYMFADLSSCDCDLVRSTTSAYLDVPYSAWDNTNSANLWGEASLYHWLDADDPPFYLIHGEDDFIVPISESELFVERYSAMGGEVELVTLPNVRHGFLAQIDDPATQASLVIIDDWLTEIRLSGQE